MSFVGVILLSIAMGLAGQPAADLDLNSQPWVQFDDIANHYKCYLVEPLLGQIYPQVGLTDQFKSSQAQVIRPRYLCNPVKKDSPAGGAQIIDPDLHYVCFEIMQFQPALFPDVKTSNQFGVQYLRPMSGELLCLPSKKDHI